MLPASVIACRIFAIRCRSSIRLSRNWTACASTSKKWLEDQPGIPIAEVKFGSPVANPGKIIGAPVNYRRHLQEAREDPEIHHSNQIAEIERVGLFLKAPSSVIGPSEAIMIRHPERRTDHEIELAVVIGKRADRVPRHRAFEYVAGYCIGLDITVRGPEERSLRKSIDTYTVLGPWLVTTDELTDPSAIVAEIVGQWRTAPKRKHARSDH